MILGQFPWRGMTVEAEAAEGRLVGEVVWLRRVDVKPGVGLGVFSNGALVLTRNAPTDHLAKQELSVALEKFQSSTAAS